MTVGIGADAGVVVLAIDFVRGNGHAGILGVDGHITAAAGEYTRILRKRAIIQLSFVS